MLHQVHLGMMGLKVFQAQQKLEQMDKDQKQRSEAQARMSQQAATPGSIPAGNVFHQQPGKLFLVTTFFRQAMCWNSVLQNHD